MNLSAVKKYLSFIDKKTFLFGFAGFILFFLILFPYEDAVQKILQFSQNSLPFQVNYESPSIKLFPPRLVLKKTEISPDWLLYPAHFDEISVSPAYLAFLTFKPGFNFNVKLKKSKADISVHKLSLSKKNSQIFRIRAKSKFLELKNLHFFSSFFKNASGSVEFFLDLKTDLNFKSEPRGELQVRAKNSLQFQPYSFPKKYIWTLSLPGLKWESFELKAEINKDKFSFKKIAIGQQNSPFYLNSKGTLNLLLSPISTSIDSYNFEMDLRLSPEIKKQFFFIDILLSNVEEKLGPNRYQYKARINGRSSYPPKIQKIKK